MRFSRLQMWSIKARGSQYSKSRKMSSGSSWRCNRRVMSKVRGRAFRPKEGENGQQCWLLVASETSAFSTCGPEQSVPRELGDVKGQVVSEKKTGVNIVLKWENNSRLRKMWWRWMELRICIIYAHVCMYVCFYVFKAAEVPVVKAVLQSYCIV